MTNLRLIPVLVLAASALLALKLLGLAVDGGTSATAGVSPAPGRLVSSSPALLDALRRDPEIDRPPVAPRWRTPDANILTEPNCRPSGSERTQRS